MFVLEEARTTSNVALLATNGGERKDEQIDYDFYCTSSSAHLFHSQGYGGRCFLFPKVLKNKIKHLFDFYKMNLKEIGTI